VIIVFSSVAVKTYTWKNSILALRDQLDPLHCTAVTKLSNNKFLYSNTNNYFNTFEVLSDGVLIKELKLKDSLSNVRYLEKFGNDSIFVALKDSIQLWNIKNNNLIYSIPVSNTRKILKLTNLSRILVRDTNHKVRVFNSKTGKRIKNSGYLKTAYNFFEFPLSLVTVKINKCILVLKLNLLLPKVLSLEVFSFL